jgi:predicted 3-demethylubiquinone-9 3-methyltransferase (glyoxalase superfamily)
MQKISPFLWFDDRIEEAVSLYVGLFPGGRIVRTSRYGPGAPRPAGTVMSMTFELAGQEFMALNGGPLYQFTPAVSFLVKCATQAEVDHYWEGLVAGGGEAQPCGWLRDRFGLSWQVIPDALGRALGDPDPARAHRAVQAMLQMTKIDIAALERALAG